MVKRSSSGATCSIEGDHIHEGNVLVLDCSRETTDGKIVAAWAKGATWLSAIRVALTKTLCKVTHCYAKRQTQHGGVLLLDSQEKIQSVLADYD